MGKKDTVGSVVCMERCGMVACMASNVGTARRAERALSNRVFRDGGIDSESGSSDGSSKGIPYVSWFGRAAGAR